MKKALSMIFPILFFLLTLTACAAPKEPPKVGTVLNIPADTEARQVKQDRTGLDKTPCKLPAQQVTITRNSYWQTFLGSTEGYTTTFLSEVEVSDKGTCDTVRAVFIEDDVLDQLIEKAKGGD